MKWCVTFPEETVMVVRPSLIAICMGDKSAAYLLSVLIEHAKRVDVASFFWTEEEILGDLCGTIGAKTLKKVAIPLLMALGYIEIPQEDYYVLLVATINKSLQEGRGEIASPHIWERLQRSREEKIITQNLHRAKARDLPATLTMQQWYSTLKHFHWLCAYCQQAPYTVLEHVVSIADGGGTTARNCVPACQSCNILKVMRGIPDMTHIEQYLAAHTSEVAE